MGNTRRGETGKGQKRVASEEWKGESERHFKSRSIAPDIPKTSEVRRGVRGGLWDSPFHYPTQKYNHPYHTQTLRSFFVKRYLVLPLTFVPLLIACAGAPEKSPFKSTESYDYSPAMKKVAAQFKGMTGVYLHIGDSLTYANPNTGWARGGKEHSDDVKAFLKWSHVGKRDDSDGYYLASADAPSGGRSQTAASGLRADELLKGAKGLPSLTEMLKKYKPQLALYMLGTNDINGGRTTEKTIADVEKAIDTILENGTIVIISTIPPIKGKTKMVEEYNNALKDLAKKKQVPLIDLYGEMKARAGDDFEKAYLSDDGVHLNANNSGGPANDENLKKSGYLLRGYLAVQKGIEVKSKVFDKK